MINNLTVVTIHFYCLTLPHFIIYLLSILAFLCLIVFLKIFSVIHPHFPKSPLFFPSICLISPSLEKIPWPSFWKRFSCGPTYKIGFFLDFFPWVVPYNLCQLLLIQIMDILYVILFMKEMFLPILTQNQPHPFIPVLWAGVINTDRWMLRSEHDKL